jgi:hypothetical protein
MLEISFSDNIVLIQLPFNPITVRLKSGKVEDSFIIS